MITVFSVLGLVIILLVFNLLRVDVTGLLVMIMLPVTGLLTAGEATAGLGSKAVALFYSFFCRCNPFFILLPGR